MTYVQDDQESGHNNIAVATCTGRVSYLLARRGEYYKYYIATYYTITPAETNDDIPGQNRVSDNTNSVCQKSEKCDGQLNQ